MSIDTLAIARDLKAADVAPAQAEAIAAAIGRTVIDAAATKADVREVKFELESRIDKLEIAIDGKFDRFKVEMMRWFLASTVAMAGVVIATAKLL